MGTGTLIRAGGEEGVGGATFGAGTFGAGTFVAGTLGVSGLFP